MVTAAHGTQLKQGYKQTDAGLIPEDWEADTLGSCLLGTPQYGINAPAAPYSDSLPTYIRITDITDDGRFSPDNMASVRQAGTDRYVLSSGDLVFARTGASVGKSYLYRPEDGELVFAGYLIRVRPNPAKLLPQYLAYYVKTDRYWTWVQAMSMRSGQPGINGTEYAQLPIPLPSPPEQRAISDLLGDVDADLTAQEKLITKKRNIRQATMRGLLTGELRLPGFSGDWQPKKLGDIAQFLGSANNSRGELSDTGDIRYIHYGDIHTKWRAFLDCSRAELPRISADRVGNVPFLEDGDLVMADASEDTEGIGVSIEVTNATGQRVVAGLHTLVLRAKKSELADGFKGYLQYVPAVKDALIKVATGISVYGISKTGVSNISVGLPDIPEQKAIAAVLSDMRAEIAALELQRDKTQAIKQGLMQELLTGRRRLA